jgi:hypothetical protein
MKAPCGIKIEVGQVWKKNKKSPECEVVSTNGDDTVNVRQTDTGWSDVIALEGFTNKRGGYKLVREAEHK